MIDFRPSLAVSCVLFYLPIYVNLVYKMCTLDPICLPPWYIGSDVILSCTHCLIRTLSLSWIVNFIRFFVILYDLCVFSQTTQDWLVLRRKGEGKSVNLQEVKRKKKGNKMREKEKRWVISHVKEKTWLREIEGGKERSEKWGREKGEVECMYEEQDQRFPRV